MIESIELSPTACPHKAEIQLLSDLSSGAKKREVSPEQSASLKKVTAGFLLASYSR